MSTSRSGLRYNECRDEPGDVERPLVPRHRLARGQEKQPSRETLGPLLRIPNLGAPSVASLDKITGLEARILYLEEDDVGTSPAFCECGKRQLAQFIEPSGPNLGE